MNMLIKLCLPKLSELNNDTKIIYYLFLITTKMYPFTTEWNRLSATYSFMLCVLVACYRVHMVVQFFWTTRAILPSP